MASLAFNAALDHSKKTWDAFMQRCIAHPPAGLLLLDSYGYHNAESKAEATARVLQAARLLPKTEIVYRLFIPNPDNPGNGDNHQLFLSSEAWADAQPREFIGTRVRIIGNNEPTHWDFQRTADWLLAVAKVAKARGFKVALAGFNVGGYEEHHIPMLDELLRYMAANPGLAWLDCHEYFKVDAYGEVAPGVRNPAAWPTQVNPDALWHLGRYKRILAYCDREGIARPDIMIGEWGPDKIDNVGGGIAVCRPIYAVYGYDPDWYLAEMLKWADRVIYTEPQVKFKAFYQYSDPDSGNWPDHNAGRFARFMAETTTGFRDMTILPTQPMYTPYPVGTYALSGNGVRVRAAADTSAPINATANSDDVITVTGTNIVSNDGYGWQPVKLGAVGGWMALRGDARVTWKLTPAPAEPEPAPIDADALRRIRDHAQAIVDECNAALEKAG